MNEDRAVRVALVALGCPKNLVNSEEMLALLTDAGYELVPATDEADLIVINTCGFIEEAKSEAIDAILDAAEQKKQRSVKIIVCGCLAQRYRREILSELPEVDALVGTTSFQKITEVAGRVLAGEHPQEFAPLNSPVPELPRVVCTGPRWAYLRIAEGCDNRCSFCVIPSLRGPYRSRSMENILDEARSLAEHGVRELIVVAQDITRYGLDLYGKPSLSRLLCELCKLDFDWIRLHYLYPEMIDDELIDEIANEPKIVKYLDIPIQHINDSILRRMNRRGTGSEIRTLFRKLRERIPGLVLRTSLITGLPGEGETEFEELCEFLREAKIERAGVFPFSPEEGTPAARMTDRCDAAEAARRAELVSVLQAEIMDAWAESFVGKTVTVFVQGFEEDGSLWGRSYADSPEIDGRVVFFGHAQPGDMVRVMITGVEDGEWIGEEAE